MVCEEKEAGGAASLGEDLGLARTRRGASGEGAREGDSWEMHFSSARARDDAPLQGNCTATPDRDQVRGRLGIISDDVGPAEGRTRHDLRCATQKFRQQSVD